MTRLMPRLMPSLMPSLMPHGLGPQAQRARPHALGWSTPPPPSTPSLPPTRPRRPINRAQGPSPATRMGRVSYKVSAGRILTNPIPQEMAGRRGDASKLWAAQPQSCQISGVARRTNGWVLVRELPSFKGQSAANCLPCCSREVKELSVQIIG